MLMKSEEQFNKEEFAVLLKQAKGKRSINQYANETGVSAAHISRFLRQMISSPPTPETISKFAGKAHNGVTYQDLMIAAGHLAREELTDEIRNGRVERYSPLNYREQMEEFRRKFLQVILADLYEKPLKWSVEKSKEELRFPDMVLNIEQDEYKKMVFRF